MSRHSNSIKIETLLASSSPLQKIWGHLFTIAIRDRASALRIKPKGYFIRPRYRTVNCRYEIVPLPTFLWGDLTRTLRQLAGPGLHQLRWNLFRLWTKIYHRSLSVFKVRIYLAVGEKIVEIRVRNMQSSAGETVLLLIKDKEDAAASLIAAHESTAYVIPEPIVFNDPYSTQIDE